MFSKKATKIDEIFTVDLTLCSKCQINGEDFVNFSGLLRKHELYYRSVHALRTHVSNLATEFQPRCSQYGKIHLLFASH